MYICTLRSLADPLPTLILAQAQSYRITDDIDEERSRSGYNLSHSGASCKTEGRAAEYSTHLELSTDSIPDQNWGEKPRVPPSLCKRLGTCHRE